MEQTNGLPGLGDRLRLMEVQSENNRLRRNVSELKDQRKTLIRLIGELANLMQDIMND